MYTGVWTIFYVFSYGTLKDEEFQKELFGRKLNMMDAALPDYKVYSDRDGYYYLKKYVGSIIKGKILEMTLRDLKISDLWEEAPIYTREERLVTLHGGDQKKKVYVYFKTNIEEEIKVNNEYTSLNSRSEVLKEIRQFKCEIRKNNLYSL